jgi:glycine cleavage system transcriptional repressor
MRWHMLTIIGHDRPRITSEVTRCLFEGGCNLGEATMARLGDSFVVMVKVGHDGSSEQVAAMVQPAAEKMDLRVNVEPVTGRIEPHQTPDVSVTVFGADRAGIVAQLTGALADAGLNILDLRSDVAGTAEEPLYVMHLEGQALEGIEALREALDTAGLKGVEVTIEPIETLIG